MTAEALENVRPLPSTSDDAAWSDRLVHEIAAKVDQRRPCMYCGTAFYEHPGVFTVVPSESDPECPALFGSAECAQRWEDRTPWQPSFRPVPTREWDIQVGVGSYGREAAR